jgi:hypothetical protein
VILEMNTQVVNRRRPRVNFREAFFRMGKVSPDGYWWTYGVVRSLSGSSVVMSGNAIFTDTPVSLIIIRDISNPSIGDQTVMALPW